MTHFVYWKAEEMGRKEQVTPVIFSPCFSTGQKQPSVCGHEAY